MKVTKDDIIKLSGMSMIDVSEAEIVVLIERINRLVEYVSVLKEIAGDQAVNHVPHNVNVMRPDVANQGDPEPLRALAPAREGNYFVVPKILKS